MPKMRNVKIKKIYIYRTPPSTFLSPTPEERRISPSSNNLYWIIWAYTPGCKQQTFLRHWFLFNPLKRFTGRIIASTRQPQRCIILPTWNCHPRKRITWDSSAFLPLIFSLLSLLSVQLFQLSGSTPEQTVTVVWFLRRLETKLFTMV